MKPAQLLLGSPSFVLDPTDTKEPSKPPASLLQYASASAAAAAAQAKPASKYKMVETKGIYCWKGDNQASLPAMNICTGAYKVASSTLQGKLLNLAEFLFPLDKKQPDLWKYTNAGNLSQRVTAFVLDAKYPLRWSTLMDASYYIPAIDRTKPAGSKRDLPNVNAILVALLLTYKKSGDVEFVNPLSNAQTQADVWNLSELARTVRNDLKSHPSTPLVLADAKQSSQSDSWSFVNFTRGDGIPTNADTAAIQSALRFRYGRNCDSTICQTQLTPGKFTKDGVSQLCYQGFDDAIALTIQSFLTIPVHMKLSEKPCVGQVLLAMDEFSAYAMALSAGAFGFGVHEHTSLLAFNKGAYTCVPLYPWKPTQSEAGETYAELALPKVTASAPASAAAAATSAATATSDPMKA